jgi:hypothetical protein
MSYDVLSTGLSVAYLRDQLTVAGNLYLNSRSFDGTDPVYGDKADSTGYVLSASLVYRLPTKSGRWAMLTTLARGRQNSDINCYDTESNTIYLGFKYRVGGGAPQEE